MAKNNVQLTSTELRQQLELLKVQLAEASKKELQPKKDEVSKKLNDLVALVKEVRELDITYVSPFTVRIDRQELTNENVLSFIGNEGRNIGELCQTFKGGGKKVKAHIATMVSGKQLVETKQPKANGRGTMTLYKKK